jgi:hypothetical protein
MAWVMFEVFLAFGLAVFIVWWTLPKKKKRKVADVAVTAASSQRAAHDVAADKATKNQEP